MTARLIESFPEENRMCQARPGPSSGGLRQRIGDPQKHGRRWEPQFPSCEQAKILIGNGANVRQKWQVGAGRHGIVANWRSAKTLPNDSELAFVISRPGCYRSGVKCSSTTSLVSVAAVANFHL
jgi:hypothetical protein